MRHFWTCLSSRDDFANQESSPTKFGRAVRLKEWIYPLLNVTRTMGLRLVSSYK